MSSGLNNPNNGGDSTMAVTLQSSRFGELQIPEEAVLDFPNGLIGLGGRRFALLARSDESAFVWLHSMDDPDLAVPVTSPWRFFEGYELELADDEAERIGVSGPSAVCKILAPQHCVVPKRQRRRPFATCRRAFCVIRN